MENVKLSNYYFMNYGIYEGKQSRFRLVKEDTYPVIKETEKAVLVKLKFAREGEKINEKSVMEFTRDTWVAKKLLEK